MAFRFQPTPTDSASNTLHHKGNPAVGLSRGNGSGLGNLRCGVVAGLTGLLLLTAACAPDVQLPAGPDGAQAADANRPQLPEPHDALSADATSHDATVLDAAADAGPGCAGVQCSGHGACEATDAGPRCACASGFVPGPNLTCVDASYCPAGEVRAAGACVPLASLGHWCDDYCGSLGLACPAEAKHADACQPYCDHAGEQGPDCVAKCLGGLDQPGEADRVVCGGLMRRFDSVDCRHLSLCAAPPVPPPAQCAQLCAAAANCGLLTDSRLLLGSSAGECQVYCGALHKVLAPFGRAQQVHQCLQAAMTSCDPVQMLGCMVVGVPELPARLCTSAASDCGYIPDVWPDVQTCEAAQGAFSAGQRIAVGGCLEIGGQYDQCQQNACAQPPEVLPNGAQQAAQAMLDHCPQLLAAPPTYPFAAEFYAWMFVAVRRAFGLPVAIDYGQIASCFVANPCSQTKAGTLQCLLLTPKD